MNEEYEARVREPEEPRTPSKAFGPLQVDVVRIADGAVIGSYRRNYSTLFRTFASFRKDGRSFALYSPNYSATRVMELPSCRDLGGEEPNSFGFCPTDYFVPQDAQGNLSVTFAFVSGCIWGDDSSWKIQVLDLSAIDKGALKRDERFGYIHLPDKLNLQDAIQVLPGTSMIDSDWPGTPPRWIAQVAVQKWFDLETGEEILWEHGEAKPARDAQDKV